MYLSVSVSVLPDSHETQPGRLMTTRILTCSFRRNRLLGDDLRSPLTVTGISFCSRPPITETVRSCRRQRHPDLRQRVVGRLQARLCRHQHDRGRSEHDQDGRDDPDGQQPGDDDLPRCPRRSTVPREAATGTCALRGRLQWREGRHLREHASGRAGVREPPIVNLHNASAVAALFCSGPDACLTRLINPHHGVRRDRGGFRGSPRARRFLQRWPAVSIRGVVPGSDHRRRGWRRHGRRRASALAPTATGARDRA